MPERHTRRFCWLSIVVAGVAMLTLPAMATQVSPTGTTKVQAAKEPGAKTSANASSAVAAAGATKSPRSACVGDRDLAALNARVLQTELMVAALSCDERTRYNEFMTSFGDTLAGRGSDLRNFFKRTAGGQGTTRMNSLITRLANDASKQSQMQADTYCKFASDLFEEVLTSSPAALTTIADKPWIRERHGFTACTTSASR